MLIAAASVLAFGTGVLPKWLAWAGFAFALVALLKFLTPLATLALLWVLIVSVLMLTGYVGSPRLAPHS